jgi:hypothetical protein
VISTVVRLGPCPTCGHQRVRDAVCGTCGCEVTYHRLDLPSRRCTHCPCKTLTPEETHDG